MLNFHAQLSWAWKQFYNLDAWALSVNLRCRLIRFYAKVQSFITVWFESIGMDCVISEMCYKEWTVL